MSANGLYIFCSVIVKLLFKTHNNSGDLPKAASEFHHQLTKFLSSLTEPHFKENAQKPARIF
jgi:hypothetical protein